MLDGAGTRPCPQLEGTPEDPQRGVLPDRASGRRGLAARPFHREQQRLGGQAKSSGETVTQALAALRALPADEQRSRVAALRDAERTCADGDRLEILTGTPAPR